MPTRGVPTSEDLQALERAINASVSLRDQALFSCMRAGVRPTEYLSAICHNGGGAYRVYKTWRCAGRNFSYVALPATIHGSVARYLKAENSQKVTGFSLLLDAQSIPCLHLSSLDCCLSGLGMLAS